MVTTILEIIATIGVPLIKLIFERIAKKKLGDKEFLAFIMAHQKRRAMAGKVSMTWETALAQAKKELSEQNFNGE